MWPTPLFLGYSQHLKCNSPKSQSCVTADPSSQCALLKIKKYFSLCGHRTQSLQMHLLNGSFLGRPCPTLVHQQGLWSFVQRELLASTCSTNSSSATTTTTTTKQFRSKKTREPNIYYFILCPMISWDCGASFFTLEIPSLGFA